MEVVVLIAVFGIVPIYIGHKIGLKKDRTGWLWGLLLGWLGVIILACMSDKNPLVSSDREVRELENQVRIAELRKQVAQTSSPEAGEAR